MYVYDRCVYVRFVCSSRAAVGPARPADCTGHTQETGCGAMTSRIHRHRCCATLVAANVRGGCVIIYTSLAINSCHNCIVSILYENFYVFYLLICNNILILVIKIMIIMS